MSADTTAPGQLRAFVERIERLEADIKEMNGDKSEVYKELRGYGFDVKTVRQCIAARKLDSAEREERDALFDLYWSALTGASLVHVHEAPFSTTPKANKPKVSSAKTEDLSTTLSAAELPPFAATGKTEADPDPASVSNSQETANEMDRADDGSFETGIEAAENRLEASPAGPVTGEVSHAGAGESPATIPEPFEPPAFLLKAAKPLRPLCLNPKLCASGTRDHCHACKKVMAESEAA